ncbi:MAG: hypothetical protein J6T91_03890 [Alphaproteobacteria bacterium]|nr:hypothetical protein [Alphaproteobacteria bacterium]
MKGMLLFIAGVAIGINVASWVEIEEVRKDRGIILSKKGEEALPVHGLKVFQIIDKEGALVRERGLLQKINPVPRVYLLLHDGQNLYYDNQEISVAEGVRVKQVGVYRYKNREGKILTVPAIRLESIKTEKK